MGDFFSGGFGGLLSGVGSLVGGLMNTSSAQAINQQQLQFAYNQLNQQQQNLQGAYLPGLVSNAQKAGVNPLAVLPGGGNVGASLSLSNPRPGDAISNSLQQMARALPEAKTDAQKLDEELKRSQLRNDAVMRQVEMRKAGLDGRGGVTASEQSGFDKLLGVKPGKEPVFPFGQIEQGGNLIGGAVRYINDWWNRQKDPFGMGAQ